MAKKDNKKVFTSFKDEKKKELALLTKQYKLSLKLSKDKKNKDLLHAVEKVKSKRKKSTDRVNKLQKELFNL
ncbi:hypothetical protein [Kurthia sibirica]|nr:hypothetical protein [Kurthia sibirica]